MVISLIKKKDFGETQILKKSDTFRLTYTELILSIINADKDI